MFIKSFRYLLVIIFAPFAIGFVSDTSDASMQCKNALRSKIMEQCSGAGTNSVLISPGDLHRRKRQLPSPSAAIASVAGPIVSEMIRGALKAGAYQAAAAPPPVPSPVISFGMVPYPIAGRPQLYLAAPSPAPTLASGLIPQETKDSGLGLDLSDDDLEELYNELSERLPRHLGNSISKDDIIYALRECCRNPESCERKGTIIPCI